MIPAVGNGQALLSPLFVLFFSFLTSALPSPGAMWAPPTPAQMLVRRSTDRRTDGPVRRVPCRIDVGY